MLADLGWEVIEERAIANLWIAEIWLIRSAWSPTDCEVYLTFEIDPEVESRDVEKVWAVSPSLSRPYDWFTENSLAVPVAVDRQGVVGSRSIAKEKYLEELFAELSNLRDEFGSRHH